MTSLSITNIGTLLTGDLASPIGEGEAVLVENGVISSIGSDASGDIEIDVGGATVMARYSSRPNSAFT